MSRTPLLCAVLATLAAPAAAEPAAPCTARSGPERATVVELFTSEGCDACPAADHWLSRLPAGPALVPLAFHVTAWNSLGWVDRFSQPAFDERQHQMAAAAGARLRYTPQVFADAVELRDWRRSGSADALQATTMRTPPGAVIDLSAQPAGSGLRLTVDATLLPPARTEDVVIFVFNVENQLLSKVKAGENRGATLRHDSVVRAMIGPWRPDAGKTTIAAPIEPVPGQRPEHSHIVVLAQDRNTGKTLQALRLPWCQAAKITNGT